MEAQKLHEYLFPLTKVEDIGLDKLRRMIVGSVNQSYADFCLNDERWTLIISCLKRNGWPGVFPLNG